MSKIEDKKALYMAFCPGPNLMKIRGRNVEMNFMSFGKVEKEWVSTEETKIHVLKTEIRSDADGYIFSVIDLDRRRQHMLGWLFHSELLEKAHESKLGKYSLLEIKFIDLREPMSIRDITQKDL